MHGGCGCIVDLPKIYIALHFYFYASKVSLFGTVGAHAWHMAQLYWFDQVLMRRGFPPVTLLSLVCIPANISLWLNL
jgi:hypothetical protein